VIAGPSWQRREHGRRWSRLRSLDVDVERRRLSRSRPKDVGTGRGKEELLVAAVGCVWLVVDVLWGVVRWLWWFCKFIVKYLMSPKHKNGHFSNKK
jgi:hypothetical protein